MGETRRETETETEWSRQFTLAMRATKRLPRKEEIDWLRGAEMHCQNDRLRLEMHCQSDRLRLELHKLRVEGDC